MSRVYRRRRVAWIVVGTVLSVGTVGTGTAAAIVGHRDWDDVQLRQGCSDAGNAAPQPLPRGAVAHLASLGLLPPTRKDDPDPEGLKRGYDRSETLRRRL
jgi:hypothetical protein